MNWFYISLILIKKQITNHGELVEFFLIFTVIDGADKNNKKSTNENQARCAYDFLCDLFIFNQLMMSFSINIFQQQATSN